MTNNIFKKLILLLIIFLIALFSFEKVVEAVDKNDSEDRKKSYTAKEIIQYVEKVYGISNKSPQGGNNYSVKETIREPSGVISAWKNKLGSSTGVDGGETGNQKYNISSSTRKGDAILNALYNNSEATSSSGGGSGSSSGSGGGSGSSSGSGGSGSSSTTSSVSKSDSEDKKKNYTPEQIKDYVNKYYNDIGNESDEVLAEWNQTLKDAGWDNIDNYGSDEYSTFQRVVTAQNDADWASGVTNDTSSSHPIYQQPRRNDNNNTSASLDDMMDDADNFVKSGGNIQYDQGALKNFSSNMYNILLTVGIAVAVIVGGILGIKLMLSSVEEKAETKKMLIAYAVGCVIVFGGFGIWKLVITVLEGI